MFKPGLPLGRDILSPYKRVQPVQPPQSAFILVCMRCGARFTSLEEAYRHQQVCRDACFRVLRV